MAVATSTAIMLGLAAAGAGLQYQNTQNTAKRQDRALAESLRNKSAIQKRADARVGEEVEKLAESRSDDERRKALDSYSAQLRATRGKANAGLDPNVGSDAFREAAATASQGLDAYGGETAALRARIDAPTMQRQGEGFGYGNLATDLGLVGREASGQDFLDNLRLRAIRRNAGKDALASLLMGAAGGMSNMGTGAVSGTGGYTGNNIPLGAVGY